MDTIPTTDMTAIAEEVLGTETTRTEKLHNPKAEEMVLKYLMDHPRETELAKEVLFSEENKKLYRGIRSLSERLKTVSAAELKSLDKTLDDSTLSRIEKLTCSQAELYLEHLKKAYILRKCYMDGRRHIIDKYILEEKDPDTGKKYAVFDEEAVSHVNSDTLLQSIKDHDNWIENIGTDSINLPLARPITEWTDKEKTPPLDLIEGWMKEGSFNFLCSGAKRGKTQLAMQMLYALRNGKPFLGMDTTQCDVLYMDFELSKASSYGRYVKLTEEFRFEKAEPFLIDNIPGELSIKFTPEEILRRIDRYRTTGILPNLKCVCLDCFYRIYKQGDADKIGDVEKFLTPFQAYSRSHNIAIIFVTHTTKSGSTGETSLLYSTSGSAIWANICDECYGIIDAEDYRGKTKDTDSGKADTAPADKIVLRDGRNYGQASIPCRYNEGTHYFFRTTKETAFPGHVDTPKPKGTGLPVFSVVPESKASSPDDGQLREEIRTYIKALGKIKNLDDVKEHFDCTNAELKELGFQVDSRNHRVDYSDVPEST